MAGRFVGLVELLMKLVAIAVLAEPYTHGKSTVNLRRLLAYAMMIPIPK